MGDRRKKALLLRWLVDIIELRQHRQMEQESGKSKMLFDQRHKGSVIISQAHY